MPAIVVPSFPAEFCLSYITFLWCEGALLWGGDQHEMPNALGAETDIPERAAVLCSRCRSTVVQEAWSCQPGNCSSEIHNDRLGLSAFPPASGFAAFSQPDVNQGLSCLPAHTGCHQSCKPAVIQSSWALVPKVLLLAPTAKSTLWNHQQPLQGQRLDQDLRLTERWKGASYQELKQHISQGAITSERHRALLNRF